MLPLLASCTCDQDEQEQTPERRQAVICDEGRSVDPPFEDVRELLGPVGSDREAALRKIKTMLPDYPRSATLRVRAGALSLELPPAGNPVEARQFYQDAVRLHQGGCRLNEALEWESIEGIALSHMLESNVSEALELFQRAASRWPTIPQTQYNLACAQCRLGQLEACHLTFVRALSFAASSQRPPFIRNPQGARYYVRLSQDDPDLELLRGDPRYKAAVSPYPRRSPP